MKRHMQACPNMTECGRETGRLWLTERWDDVTCTRCIERGPEWLRMDSAKKKEKEDKQMTLF